MLFATDPCILVLCKFENDILQKAIEYVKTQKIIVNVPMFDGMMCDIRNTEHTTDSICKKLNKLTIKYGIKWSHKEHNIEILDLLNSFVYEEHILKYIGNNEVDVANYLLSTLLNNKIYVCNGDVWIYQKPIWTNFKVEKLLIPMISPHNLLINSGINIYPANKSESNLKSLIGLIMAHAPKKDDFYTIMHKDTKGRLFYNNGYYEFKDNKFVIYDNDNIPFTSFVIKRDFINDNTLIEMVAIQ